MALMDLMAWPIDVRTAAVEALGKLGDVRAVEPLILLFRNVGTRKAALREAIVVALGEIGDARAVDPLIYALTNTISPPREAIVVALGKLGDTSTVEPLIDRLKRAARNSASRDHRAEHSRVHGIFDVAGLLGTTGDARALGPLIELLEGADWDCCKRSAAARGLGWLGDVRAVDPLTRSLGLCSVPQSCHFCDDFIEVVLALAGLKDPRSLQPLVLQLTEHEDEDCRANAAEAIGVLGFHLDSAGTRACTALSTALECDTSERVRYDAVEAIVDLGDARAVDPLMSLLSAGKSDVRSKAAWALGKLGAVRAVDPLISLLTDTDSNVRSAAANALGRLGDERAVDPLICVLDDADSGVRLYAARALGRLGGAQAVDPLRVLLDDIVVGVRVNAARALAGLGDESAIERIIGHLGDDDEFIRQAAAEALGELGDARAMEPLISALDESSVRWHAASALGELCNIRPLVGLLRDESKSVRRSAIDFLTTTGQKDVFDHLVDLLQHKHGMVRYAAAESLGELRDVRAVEPLLALLGRNTGGLAGLVRRAKKLLPRTLR